MCSPSLPIWDNVVSDLGSSIDSADRCHVGLMKSLQANSGLASRFMEKYHLPPRSLIFPSSADIARVTVKRL
jgi:hypothetical protein